MDKFIVSRRLFGTLHCWQVYSTESFTGEHYKPKKPYGRKSMLNINARN